MTLARTCRRERALAARDRGSGGRDQCLRFVAAGVVILFSLSPLFAGRGKASRAYASLALGTFEFERDVELGAIGFDLAFGVQLQIELHDFGDAKIPEGLSGSADGHRGRLFPGILAGTNQLNHLVDAVSHIVLPFDVRRRCSCHLSSLTSGNQGRKDAAHHGSIRIADSRKSQAMPESKWPGGSDAVRPFLDQVSMR